MIDRRFALVALASSSLLLAGLPAFASEKTPFSKAAFGAAMASGKPIFIDVAASWCPTCQVQASILSTLAKQPKFKDVVFLGIDFDGQKEILRGFRVQNQSTLIAFKDGKEVGRSVGDTNRASIEALLARTI